MMTKSSTSFARRRRSPNVTIAEGIKINPQYMRGLWAKYRSTGSLLTISSGGWPATKTVPDEEVKMVLAECKRGCFFFGGVCVCGGTAHRGIDGEKHKRPYRIQHNERTRAGRIVSCKGKNKNANG